MTDHGATVQTNADSTRPRYVDVAVDGAHVAATGGHFTYEIPGEMDVVPSVGQLVWVPLRKRLVHGIVIDYRNDTPAFPTRRLHAVVEPPIGLSPLAVDISMWMARETASGIFPCAALFLPPGRKRRAIQVLRLAPGIDLDAMELTPVQARLVVLLTDAGEMTLQQAKALTGQALTSVVPELMRKGILVSELRPDDRVPRQRVERFVRLLDPGASLSTRASRQTAVLERLQQFERLRRDEDSDLVSLPDLRKQIDADAGTLEALVSKGMIEVIEMPLRDAPQSRASAAPQMNAAQAAAWLALEQSLKASDPTPHLLFGVTGSGKTEIYLRVVGWCIRHRKTAIVMVPEIALAAQVVGRFIDRFAGNVAVLHSQLTDIERYDVWRSIAAGEISVVVGPRSALFAPVENLGAIIIDEEHDASYKQDSEPRYHARAVASYLSERHGATLVLGSATPSIESFWKAQEGIYQLLELPERIAPIRGSDQGQNLELPRVEIVDLKAELRRGNAGLLSHTLLRHVGHTLSRGEQTILLLNRRGMSTVVICRACGHRLECPQCDIALVYHKDRQELICHRCDYRATPPTECPECGGRLDFFGAGTQRVEAEVQRQFPDARVLRWDKDAVRRGGGYRHMLDMVEGRQVDIIVGTQMVSKGFDLPAVTSIGVVQADSLLYLPDFRSAERTFQLLTQVAGRAGRRGPGSTVVFQTYTPEHYAVVAASNHNYRQFYGDEIVFREGFRFPPFVRMARFVIRHDKEGSAALEAGLFARELVRHARTKDIDMELLGPTPAFIARIRKQYQWQIILRTREMNRMLENMPIRPGWAVDIDPESML